eukprot:3916918-Amphidinium_carterae.1
MHATLRDNHRNQPKAVKSLTILCPPLTLDIGGAYERPLRHGHPATSKFVLDLTQRLSAVSSLRQNNVGIETNGNYSPAEIIAYVKIWFQT